MPQRSYTRTEVTRLAALSRAYWEALPDINAAIMQEIDLDPECRAEVGVRFGLPEGEFPRCLPERRAGLRSTDEVLADVMRDIEAGRLKPGDQLPPRTRFTVEYHCDKKVHGEVTAELARRGVVYRPGGVGGPMRVH